MVEAPCGASLEYEKEAGKMMKRMARVLAAIALIFAMGVPAVAFAAPGDPTLAPAGNLRLPWYAQWRPFPIWPSWGYKPDRGTGLEYQVSYVAEKHEVQLLVVNPTDEPITVTTPSAMKTDFALWQEGKLVWRANMDRTFAQAVTNETFQAGEGKVYKESLPYLATGAYFLQAYYVGETKWAPVASTWVWIVARVREPLQYTVAYLGPGWFNSSPRLRVTIKNTSDRDITLPYQYGYQVLVKKPGDKDYLGNVGIGQSLGTIAAGATRYLFVNLNDLEPGVYQADVRSNVATGRYRVMAQTWFYTW